MNDIKIRPRRATWDNNHTWKALYFHALGTGDDPFSAMHDLLSNLSPEEQKQFGYELEPEKASITNRSIRG